MRKLFLSLLFLIGIIPVAWSQMAIGFQAGYGKNYLTTNNDYRNFIENQPLESFSIAVPIKYNLNKWLDIQSGVELITKGNKLKRYDFLDGIYYQNSQNYLQIPITAKMYVGEGKLRGFFNMGAYAGYWMSGRSKGALPHLFSINPSSDYILNDDNRIDYDENYEFNKNRDRRIDLGLLLGTGLTYKLNPNFEIYVEGRYSRSMLDMQKNYMENQISKYNDTYTLHLGLFYNLRNKVSKN